MTCACRDGIKCDYHAATQHWEPRDTDKPPVPEWVALIANGGEPHPVAECYECRDKLDFLAAVLTELWRPLHSGAAESKRYDELLRWARAQGGE